MNLVSMLRWLIPIAVVTASSGTAHPLVEVQPLKQEELSVIKADVEGAMQNIKPSNDKNPPKNQVLPKERFVLWGDLFGDGHVWAITETKNHPYGAAYLEWENRRWQLRQIWDAQVDWIPEGAKPEDREYFHSSPPHVPFLLKDLNGDGVPEILISFSDGYSIGYQIAEYDAKKERITMLDVLSGDGEPEYADGYLITHHSSGRKAWWGENEYHIWKERRPVSLAVWREASGETGEERFEVTVRKTMPTGPCSYVVVQNDEGAHVISRDAKPFAVINFKWKEKHLEQRLAGGQPAAEELYLFEKLTALPWKAYGKKINDEKLETAKEWQSLFDVEVTGTPEGIKLLSKSGGKRDKK